MGKRTDETDIVAMALLYRNQCDGTGILSYEKALEYDRVINANLDVMNSPCGISDREETDNRLYFTSTDANGDLFAIINPSADLDKARSWHIGCLPVDVIVASQMPNALDVIGLELVDGRFLQKKDQQRELLR